MALGPHSRHPLTMMGDVMTDLTPLMVNNGLKSVRRAAPRFALLGLMAMSLSGCVGLVLAGTATTGALVAQDRTIGSGFDDTAIDMNIKSQYAEEKFKTFRRVNVEVYEGRVMLTGNVPTVEDRAKAVQIAWATPKVEEVINEIEINDRSELGRWPKDTWISTRLKSKLIWDAKVNSFNYQIEIVNGNVYLAGVAKDAAELERVTDHARKINGVKKVVSHVRLKESPRRQAVALEGSLAQE